MPMCMPVAKRSSLSAASGHIRISHPFIYNRCSQKKHFKTIFQNKIVKSVVKSLYFTKLDVYLHL